MYAWHLMRTIVLLRKYKLFSCTFPLSFILVMKIPKSIMFSNPRFITLGKKNRKKKKQEIWGISDFFLFLFLLFSESNFWKQENISKNWSSYFSCVKSWVYPWHHLVWLLLMTLALMNWWSRTALMDPDTMHHTE